MSLANDEPKLHVAIIGGGMGGLVLALCLKKYAPDVHFTIYESAAELTEVGAGIGMSPRIWTIMRELGLEDELLTITGTRDRGGSSFSILKGDEGRIVDVVQFNQIHTFHRSLLQQLLAKHLDAGDRIHFSKRLASYSETSSTEPITLTFKDGTTATCDLVVGSDGIRSAVRRTMFNDLGSEAEKRGQAEEAARLREMVNPVFSGQIAYRGLAPASALSPELLEYSCTGPNIRVLVGKNRNIVIYPVSGGKFINVLAAKYTPGSGPVYDGPWSEPTTGEAVVEMLKGWEPRALGLIKAVKEPFGWAMHTVRELPTYVNGRAALVGDAAHGMLPHQGSGVGQAFEDGYILATILAHPSVTLANLPAALMVYDDVRRPFSQNVQQGSDRNGMNYQLRRAGWEDVSVEDSRAGRYPPELLGVLAEELRKQIEWAFETSILDERARVEQRLVALSA